MKKLIIKATAFIILTAGFFSVKAQTGYVITNEGKKVSIYGDPSVGSDLTYKNKDAKNQKFSSKDIKLATYKDSKYGQINVLSLSYKGDDKVCLQQVVGYNDKYIMTWFFENRHQLWAYVSVYDWNFNPVVQFKRTMEAGMLSKKVDKNALVSEIEPYFKDCPDFINALKANVNNPNTVKEIYEYIYNVQCGKKSFETLIQPFLNGQTNNGQKK